MKANSPDFSGQFSASVKLPKPNQLKLEVTNFLGGTEASIRVDDQHYQVLGPRGELRESDEGFGSWSGIPLRWATDLFLGKIPCPPFVPAMEVKMNAEDSLLVQIPQSGETDAQEFVFRFRFDIKSDNFWPESLHWTQKSVRPLSVEFKFDDPEEKTRSPKKWEAKSARGTIKVRWRERLITSLQAVH